MQKCIFFSVSSLFNGQVKNVDSAQISVPGQIKKSVDLVVYVRNGDSLCLYSVLIHS